ncbi:MAG TPA: peptide chain release factor N(5)-glutamine methyltransferase [Candidatus Paceibacterota bacterium]|nr:peptide chain release factor N(5)-glutamine methyltransferase [Candidatus Paceibacterota bacterium]
MDSTERDLLIRDKYNGDNTVDLSEDLARLSRGEPPAYVIGWIPFLGLRIDLDSRPLIPRPETEWWTEVLHARLAERFADKSFRFLDLCAGSGAIGLSVLHAFPAAHVSFGELVPEHVAQIKKNLERNGLDTSRASIQESDLFAAFAGEAFDVIATNPPYVPDGRVLDASVTEFEPSSALYAGSDGLSLVKTIVAEAPRHILPGAEIWIECDIKNAEEAVALLEETGAHAEMRTDLYGRPRIAVGYYA